MLAILLAISLPFSLAAHDLGRVLFSPESMSELIVSRVVENGQLRRLLVARLLGGGASAEDDAEGFDMARASSYLTPAELDEIGDALFPPGWVEEQIASIMRQLYAWLDNDEPSPGLALDLRPVAAWLRSGGAHEFVETLVDSWPACGLQQVEQMLVEAARRGRVSVQYCEPPEPYRTALMDFAATALLAQVEAMPRQLRLSGVSAGTDAEQVMALKEQMRLVRLLLTHGWLLPLSLLGLIMTLAVRSYPDLARWWGIPLLGGGLLGLALLLVGGAVAEQAIERMAERQASELLALLVKGMGGGLVEEAQRRLFWQLLVLTMASSGLILSGAVVGRRKRDLGVVPPSAVGS